MRKDKKSQFIIFCIMLLLIAFCSSNVFSFGGSFVDTTVYGGVCPCCNRTDATVFLSSRNPRIPTMLCARCGAIVNVTRDNQFRYTVELVGECPSSSQNQRTLANQGETATLMETKIAVARFSVSPELRLFVMREPPEYYWQSYPNFQSTVATYVDIPWGRKFNYHNENGEHYLTFDLPDSMMPAGGSGQGGGVQPEAVNQQNVQIVDD